MDQFEIPFYMGIASLLLFDGETSRSLTDKAPIFGSANNADSWSDMLGLSLIPLLIYSSTVTNTPTVGEQTNLGQKSKLVGFESLILLTDFVFVEAVKNIAQRSRPDYSDRKSFPSGHSSISAGLSVMIFNNIENSRYKATTYGQVIQNTAVVLAGTVAYARIEAKKHHLSDVFFGHAIGAYIADFLYKGFLQLKPNVTTSFYVNQHEQLFQMNYHF
jgi:membrane-associated phospholipid phosphatase